MELARLLEKMKMEHLLMQIDAVCEQASKKDLPYREFLTEALQTEWRGRRTKAVEARLKMARFPWVKTLDQFDFLFQPSIDRKVIRELGGLSFVDRAENVILLGPPGVGKTHLAIALGVKAVEAGYRVLFLTLESMLTRLSRARMGKPCGKATPAVRLSQAAHHRRNGISAHESGRGGAFLPAPHQKI